MSHTPLAGLDEPPCSVYDLAMLDLDGVVYVGDQAVAGVTDVLGELARHGMHVAFVTNNAARTPAVVAQHLTELGVPAGAEDVVTSAQAAASLLSERHGRGARIACLGGPGLEWALDDAGLEVAAPGEDAAALVSGYGPDVPWRAIMQAAVRVRDGLPWVATNTDSTIPTRFGVAPGHGVLVRMISEFAGTQPEVAGKPQPPLLRETIRRVGGSRPLMVGDRLDTDIAGGRTAGVDSFLVLTGVTDLAGLVAARPQERPTYLARDLAGLLKPQPAPVSDGDGWRVGGWIATVHDRRLLVEGDGSGDDWWRAAACAAWTHVDTAGEVPEVDPAGVPEVAVVPR